MKKNKVFNFIGFHVPRALNDGAEKGRSMVEMLGVLAVIGVLSIGGIAGYRYAMNKYRANEIISELNLVAMNASTYILNKGRNDCPVEAGRCMAISSGSGSLPLKLTSCSVYDAAYTIPEGGYIEGAFFITLNSSTTGVFKEMFSNQKVCQLVLSNYDWPFRIVNYNRGAATGYDTVLTEAEAVELCSNNPSNLFFYFNDDLS